MEHFWYTFGTLLGHFWYTFGALLGHFWVTFGSLLEHFWYTFRTLLAHFWYTFRTLLVHFWYTFGTRLAHFWDTSNARLEHFPNAFGSETTLLELYSKTDTAKNLQKGFKKYNNSPRAQRAYLVSASAASILRSASEASGQVSCIYIYILI